MKTPEQLAELKASWRYDPCWDIETTEGFEEHEEELLAYRLDMEAIWKQEREERRAKRMEELGIPGNEKLLDYIEGLEYDVKHRIEQRLTEIEKHLWPNG